MAFSTSQPIFFKANISSCAESRPGLKDCKAFYMDQSRHTLGQDRDRQKVPIYISGNVHPDWISFLTKGIAEINEACPGVHLFQAEKCESEVYIQGSASAEVCSTYWDIARRPHKQVRITLVDDYSRKRMKRTSVHELLHALGAQHEHQAADADSFLYNECPREHKQFNQFVPNANFIKVTRRDPFSIMMYPEGNKNYLHRKEGSDTVWNLKASNEMNNEMSELDKVGLNYMYPPCRSAAYNPQLSSVTGMWYCGRHVMQNHNRPAESTTDDRCGPTMGANCPACRSLENPVVNILSQSGRWQGWSGLVYCGDYFGKQEPGHDGYCGPNNGPPCPQCKDILLRTTSTVSFHLL